MHGRVSGPSKHVLDQYLLLIEHKSSWEGTRFVAANIRIKNGERPLQPVGAAIRLPVRFAIMPLCTALLIREIGMTSRGQHLWIIFVLLGNSIRIPPPGNGHSLLDQTHLDEVFCVPMFVKACRCHDGRCRLHRSPIIIPINSKPIKIDSCNQSFGEC
jgi:hypothetical protein